MKTYTKAAAALALALVGAGCSDFLSGPGLTENPNNPVVGTPLQQMIAMQSNMSTRLEGQLARCAGVFTQQLIGSNNQQLSYCTQYGVTEQDISGHMSGFYTGGGLVAMRNIQNSGDPLLAGMAKIWEGLAFGTATSVWGDLPYSEANNLAILTPRLDPQEDIYGEVQARLDEGIALLQTAPAAGNCDPADLIYCASGGTRQLQIQRWIAAANTLKARFHLHLVERNGVTAYQAALAAALLGIAEAPTSPADAMHGQAPGDFRTFHGTIQDFDMNIWTEFLLARQDLVAGNSLVQILTSRGDPRIAAYFTANSAGAYIGHDQNNVKIVLAPVADSSPAVINLSVRRSPTVPFRQPIVTWAENQLILAEAKYMTGDSAGAVGHVDAVRTAVGMTGLGNVSFTDVMLEKHIAMFQNIDVWSDYKRTCIPALTPFGSPPEPEVLGRMPYGSAERTANPNVPLPSAYPTGTTGASAVRNWNDPTAC